MSLVLAIASSRTSVTLSTDHRIEPEGQPPIDGAVKLVAARWSDSEAALIGWAGPHELKEHWSGPVPFIRTVTTLDWLRGLVAAHQGTAREFLETLQQRAEQDFREPLTRAHIRMGFLLAGISGRETVVGQVTAWEFDGRFMLHAPPTAGRSCFIYSGQVTAVEGETQTRLRALGTHPAAPDPSRLSDIHRRVAAHPVVGSHCSPSCTVVRLGMDRSFRAWDVDASGATMTAPLAVHGAPAEATA